MTLVYHRGCLKYPNWIWIILSKAINFDRMIIDLVTRDGNAGVNDDNTTAGTHLGCFLTSGCPECGHSRGVVYFKTHMAGFVWDAAQLGNNPYTYVEVKTLLDGVTVAGIRSAIPNRYSTWRTAVES